MSDDSSRLPSLEKRDSKAALLSSESAPAGAGVLALMEEKGSASGSCSLAIDDWLKNVHPSLKQYADALIDYGYDDTQMLLDLGKFDPNGCIDPGRLIGNFTAPRSKSA